MSPETSEDRPKPEIVTDEDWKQRIKAEDAALDQKLKEETAEKQKESQPDQAESDSQQPDQAVDPQHIPPAEFATLVSMFASQAMISLGVIPNPVTGQAETQLPLARHFIDLLDVLQEKTKGNLESGEQSLLESSLHQLRVVYIEKTKTDS